jgi:phospholipid transport system substrate-binding protein
MHPDQRHLPRRGLLLGAAVAAVVVTIPHARAADDAAGAAAPIERLSEALVAVGRAGRATSFEQRIAMLAPAVDGAFDLSAVLRVSVGPRWDALSPEEQAQLEAVFRKYTVASYVSNLATGDRPKVSPQTRALPNGDEVVDTEAGDVKLSYVMRRTPSGWKAVDVLADGAISRVAVQRSDFRALLAKGGGQALVASLQQKVDELAG